MIIKDIRTYYLKVPVHGNNSALGRFDFYEYGIVFVDTDTDITGIGEISMLWDGNAKTQLSFVEHYFKPLLIGMDPCNVTLCLNRMNTLVERAHPARAAVEMALLDIAGKRLNTPVYNLLGGKVREKIQLSRSIHYDSLKKMKEEAEKYISSGYKCLKVKVGISESDDMRNLEEIRKTIGDDILLRIDANMAWKTAKQAIRMIKKLEAYDLHSVEQPMPPGASIQDLKLVRNSVDVPVMADESIWGPDTAWEMLEAGAYDMMNVYVAESGGLLNSQLIFKMGELRGVGCVIGSMPELGIGTAAQIHLGLSCMNLAAPCDACGATYVPEDIINETFVVSDGYMMPLEGPGLGVSVDFEKFNRWVNK